MHLLNNPILTLPLSLFYVSSPYPPSPFPLLTETIALLKGAYEGDDKAVVHALRDNACVEAKEERMRTALALATGNYPPPYRRPPTHTHIHTPLTKHSYLSILLLLLMSQHIHTTPHHTTPPPQTTSENGHKNIVNLLLAQGADPNCLDNEVTPLCQSNIYYPHDTPFDCMATMR